MTSADAPAVWRSLWAEASAPYRRSGRFAWHFARGKLRWDPVFRHLLARGLIAPGTRVLDIGCGQGLLASLLAAAAGAARRGHWPAGWGEAPLGVRVRGIELMARDVARARRALGDRIDIVCADMRSADFGAADTIVILDVLHYVAVAEQDAVLARVRAALSEGGRLVLRVGDASSRHRFLASHFVDRVVTFVRGHGIAKLRGRPLAAWQKRLVELGFSVQREDLQGGPPFANVLLVATVAAVPTAPEAGPVSPETLDRAGIAALIPHRGPMCLLERMTSWRPDAIECVATGHRDPRHPLRSASGLLATATIEYAAQATALHGALCARADDRVAAAGFLASARDVRLACWRLDDLPPAAVDELVVGAERLAADAGRILYAFRVRHGGREVAAGRIAVVLDAASARSARSARSA